MGGRSVLQRSGVGTMAALATVCGLAPVAAAANTTVFDNGMFITGPGTGVNSGAQVSRAESAVPAIGFNEYATGAQGGPIRIADDFIISGAPAGGVQLSTMTFYGLQTNTVTNNVQFQKFFVALYDRAPFAGGSLLAGDFTTSRLISSEWSGVYRLLSSGSPDTSRPITRLTVDMSWAPRLHNGAYWLLVSAVGDSSIAATPVPYTIFVTPHPANANAQQFYGGQWYAIWDVPFTLRAFCPADFNRSSDVTVQDIFDFLNAWFAGREEADFNGGGLAVSDIFDYLNAWFAGCP